MPGLSISGTIVPVGVVVVLGLFIGLGIGLPLLPWPTRKSPKRVVIRLRGGVYETRVRAGGGIWNPAKPFGVDNLIFGPGDARYWTDESGLVHLDLWRSNGKIEKYSGPVPERLTGPTGRGLRSRGLAGAIVVGYLALLALGFVVGYFVTTGSALNPVVGGGIGVFVAEVIACIISFVSVGRYSVATARKREPSTRGR